MKKLLLFLFFYLPLIVFAQRQALGNLTIFSEDGDKFYLVLNGEKQSEVAQTNIRVEELVQPYYSAKLIFKDSTIPSISKTYLYIADANGTMMDVTYKIRRDKSGKVKLNYFSMIEVPKEYTAPPGMYVHHYGEPVQVDGGVTRTTTTTTTAPVAASVNVNGVSMNVTINDPLETSSTTSTTTTTHSSSSSNTTTSNTHSDGDCSNSWAMRSSDFGSAKRTIEQASFEDSKLSTAKNIASSNCLSSDQVVEICQLFSFEETKLTFAKFAYKHSTDPKNYFKVNNVFSFDASKEDLNKFMGVGD